MQSTKSPSPKGLSNESLLRNTQTLVAEERKLTTEILWHLHEIQVRRLYAEKGYASLFEYAVQALGYSEAAAGRRIAAMRLLADLPEIETALQKGEVTLSTLSTVQSYIQRKEEPVSKSEKRDLVFALKGKSRRECEKHLVTLDPVAATPKERERVISSTQTEIRFVADDELIEKLQKIKELDGHVQSNPSYLELFHRLADLVLKKLDPLTVKEKRSKPSTSSPTAPSSLSTSPSTLTAPSPASDFTPPAALNEKVASLKPGRSEKLVHPKTLRSRYIPAALKREIWKRDQARCSYRSPDGKQCSSRYALEVDHIQPFALGGYTTLENLRLLCRAHNTYQAVLKLGSQAMQAYVS
jgi:hypothetical protein